MTGSSVNSLQVSSEILLCRRRERSVNFPAPMWAYPTLRESRRSQLNGRAYLLVCKCCSPRCFSSWRILFLEADVIISVGGGWFSHRQTTLRMWERVTSLYFETVVTADSTDRGKCFTKTSNRYVSFRKFILCTAPIKKHRFSPRGTKIIDLRFLIGYFDLIKFQWWMSSVRIIWQARLENRAGFWGCAAL